MARISEDATAIRESLKKSLVSQARIRIIENLAVECPFCRAGTEKVENEIKTIKHCLIAI